MGKIFDIVLKIFKWPAAVYLILSVPALVKSFDYFDFFTFKFYALSSGILFYGVTILALGYDSCRNMQVISHELTHTVFAYLTFHDAGRIRLNPDGSGGSMMVKGGGNWLITLAPYFFPLLAFIYMLFMPTLLNISDKNWLVYAVFGYFVAYYWATVLDQVHPRQTDIIREGYIFSAIVIVAANLYTTGIMLAFNSKLWSGTEIYLKLVHKLNMQNWHKLLDMLSNQF